MKTLGICIPTYRRPELLMRCVLSAITSAGPCPIQVFVADDSMSDVNDASRDALSAAYSFVHWHCNESNLGIDANIQQIVDLCDCDYAWLIGEDDVFLPGAVARMHKLIQTLDAPFLFANYRYVGDTPDRVLGIALDARIPDTVRRDDFIAEHLWAVGFIGACVLQKQPWAATEAAPYIGTYYTHVGRIAEMLARSDAVAVLGSPSVANRVEGRDTFTWKKDSYGVFFGFVEMCRRVGKRVPSLAPSMQLASHGFERKFRWLSVRLAARLRSEHAFDHAQFVKYFRQSHVGTFKRLMFLGISIAPPRLFQPLVWLYRATRR